MRIVRVLRYDAFGGGHPAETRGTSRARRASLSWVTWSSPRWGRSAGARGVDRCWLRLPADHQSFNLQLKFREPPLFGGEAPQATAAPSGGRRSARGFMRLCPGTGRLPSGAICENSTCCCSALTMASSSSSCCTRGLASFESLVLLPRFPSAVAELLAQVDHLLDELTESPLHFAGAQMLTLDDLARLLVVTLSVEQDEPGDDLEPDGLRDDLPCGQTGEPALVSRPLGATSESTQRRRSPAPEPTQIVHVVARRLSPEEPTDQLSVTGPTLVRRTATDIRRRMPCHSIHEGRSALARGPARAKAEPQSTVVTGARGHERRKP